MNLLIGVLVYHRPWLSRNCPNFPFQHAVLIHVYSSKATFSPSCTPFVLDDIVVSSLVVSDHLDSMVDHGVSVRVIAFENSWLVLVEFLIGYYDHRNWAYINQALHLSIVDSPAHSNSKGINRLEVPFPANTCVAVWHSVRVLGLEREPAVLKNGLISIVVWSTIAWVAPGTFEEVLLWEIQGLCWRNQEKGLEGCCYWERPTRPTASLVFNRGNSPFGSPIQGISVTDNKLRWIKFRNEIPSLKRQRKFRFLLKLQLRWIK